MLQTESCLSSMVGTAELHLKQKQAKAILIPPCVLNVSEKKIVKS